jgi:hypothetical protein
MNDEFNLNICGAPPHTRVEATLSEDSYRVLLLRGQKKNQEKATRDCFSFGLLQPCSVNSRNSPAPYGTGSNSLEFLTLVLPCRPETINGARKANLFVF